VFICGGGSLEAYIAGIARKVIMSFANMLDKGEIQDELNSEICSPQSMKRYHKNPYHRQGN